MRGIAYIADNILIYGTGETEEMARANHDENLRASLQPCRDKGIKLNHKKLRLFWESTLYCGHELTRKGCRPDKRKLEAIQNMIAPSDREGVLRLLGMATYLAKFCAHFGETTAPIRALLKGDNDFCQRPEVTKC